MSTPRIAIVGPESSGKSTLAHALADVFDTALVPEIARTFVSELGRAVRESDLVEIARRQQAAEDRAAAASPRVVCDTNLLVVRVWAEVKYGRVDSWISRNERLDRYALHLLTAPDLPWEPDPLRDAPTTREREALFVRYREALERAGAPFVTIGGDEREARARGAIRRFVRWEERGSTN